MVVIVSFCCIFDLGKAPLVIIPFRGRVVWDIILLLINACGKLTFITWEARERNVSYNLALVEGMKPYYSLSTLLHSRRGNNIGYDFVNLIKTSSCSFTSYMSSVCTSSSGDTSPMPITELSWEDMLIMLNHHHSQFLYNQS